MDEKKSLLSEIKKLEELKLTVEQVERLRGLIVRISSDHKVDPLQAYNRFEQDILQSYNTILGLRPEASRLEENKRRIEAEISTKKKDLESVEATVSDKIKKLDEKYSKQKEEVEAYNQLRALGIDGKRILSWNQIMKSANLDYGTIEGELRNQANLKGLEDKTSAKIKELVAEELKTFAVGLSTQSRKTENRILDFGDARERSERNRRIELENTNVYLHSQGTGRGKIDRNCQRESKVAGRYEKFNSTTNQTGL